MMQLGFHKRLGFVFAVIIAYAVLSVIAAVSALLFLPDAGAYDIDRCQVVSAVVKDKVDGLGPFDADDAPGNDSGPRNDVVRSFDTVNFTIEYVTATKGSETVDSARLMVEFTLPCTKAVAQFDMSAMHWLQEARVTDNPDGTQTLTGYRVLQNSDGVVMVPGAGTLSVGIAVKGADYGTVLTPAFKMWMEGNSDAEKVLVTSGEHSLSTTVSAIPKVNVRIQRNGYMRKLAAFDFATGQEAVEGEGVYGRMFGYGIALELRGDSAAKGLKGVAVPTGDIEFDIVMREAATETGAGASAEPDSRFVPMFWDYSPVSGGTTTGRGGRNMFWDYNGLTRLPTHCCPYSSGGSYDSCYDSGTWSIVDNGDGTLHVTVSGYRFNTSTWAFPTHTNSSASQAYNADYVGHFSTQYIQVLCTEPQEVGAITNVYLGTHVRNLQVTSGTGQIGGDKVGTDNSATALVTLYPSGSFSKSVCVLSSSAGRSSSWQNSYGDAYDFAGSNITAQNYIFRDGDNRTGSLDYLFKFDTDGLRLRPGAKASDVTFSPSVAASDPGHLKVLFAAKPDGTPWADDAEMIRLKQEDLLYFSSLEALEASGATCVGVLAELRDADLYHSWTCGYVYVPLQVRDDAEAGEVYIMTSDARAWDSGIENSFTMEGLSYPYDRSGSFVTGYPTPTAQATSNGYTATQYDESGNIVGGHTGGWALGNSILVIGYKAYISKSVADTDGSGRPKSSYDMDANERTVKFRLQPSLSTSGSAGGTTTLYVTDILPPDLSYDEGTSYWGTMPITPSVSPAAGGGTKLEYVLENAPVGATVPPVTLSCTIGSVGTVGDVQNNQIITNAATIRGSGDKRKIEANNGNYTERAIAIIKLSALSLSKSTDTPYVRIGQEFRYSFTFANTSENAIPNASLYDVLPWNGDSRNSSFGGTYSLDRVVMDFKDAPNTFADYVGGGYAFRATDSESVRGTSFADVAGFSGWTDPLPTVVDAAAKTVTVTGFPEGTTAFKSDLSMLGNESVHVSLAMRGHGSQHAGDVYVNNVYESAPGQAKEVTSNQAAVQIYGSITMTKTWDDGGNAQGTRPDNIELHLMQDGHVYRTAVLASGNDSVTLQDIPFYDQRGIAYEYSVEEVPVSGYVATVGGTKETGFFVTNAATRTTIKKVSNDGASRLVVGARLQVLDSAGSVVREWVTTATSQEYEAIGLAVGTPYVLHEESPPAGFDRAADIPFSIDANGKVTYGGSKRDFVTMVDEYHASGSMPVSAMKSLVGRALADKEFLFEIRDAAGTVVSSGTNSTSGTISMSDIEFDEGDIGKTRSFVFSEQQGSDATVRYDDTRYRLDVEVSDNGDGTLTLVPSWFVLHAGEGLSTPAAGLEHVDGSQLGFTNYVRVPMPLTGLRPETLFSGAFTLVVVIGCVMLGVSKRRQC